MALAFAILAGIGIYSGAGWAAWWANGRVTLGPEMPGLQRLFIRFFVAAIVFIAVSFPLVFALERIFG